MIEAIKVHKSFGYKQVLRDLDLKIPRGEAFALMGQSGCGKSVFLKCLLGLIRIDRGQIKIDGEKLQFTNQRQMKQVRRNLGMLFQNAALFDSYTVEQNIAFPLREHTSLSINKIKKRVTECLELVGLPGIQRLKPHELSGGMKKRVGLARAIVTKPNLLIYDEPTTGLDPVTQDAIIELMVQLRDHLQVTCIAVTHDVKLALELSHRVGLLYQGKLRFTGTPEAFRNSRDPYVTRFALKGY